MRRDRRVVQLRRHAVLFTSRQHVLYWVIELLPELLNGVLPEGTHDATLEEVLNTFASNSESRNAARMALRRVVFALHEAGAKYLLIGGSLPTSKAEIADVDMVAVFTIGSAIPTSPLHISGLGITVDVQYASEDEEEILAALVEFFQVGRDGNRRGILRILLRENDAPSPLVKPSDAILRVVRDVYLKRYFARTTPRRGLLVTIHGVMSHAPWNAHLARLASSQGWVVAPYVYGYQSPLILVCKSRRGRIVDDFREWLHRVATEEDLPISVVAHSFGTYIAARYLLGFDQPPHGFNGLILTGSILSRDLDWDLHAEGRIGRILHERAPSDSWVSQMSKLSGMIGDPLLGDSGVTGFRKRSSIVQQRKAELFSHTNVIAPDVISGRWLPFLNAHALSGPKIDKEFPNHASGVRS